jgi:hypothetical protein
VPGSVFHPIVPIWVKNGDKVSGTYALLDQGANASAIRTELARSLDMDIVEKDGTISGFGYKSSGKIWTTQFSIETLDNSIEIPMVSVLVGDILTTEDEKPHRNQNIEEYDYMKDKVYFENLEDDFIGMILLAQLAWTWLQNDTVRGRIDEPIAMNTIFG